jgi:hypothetical protein
MDAVARLERRAHAGPPLEVVVELLAASSEADLSRVAEYTLALRRQLPAQRDPLVLYGVIGVVVNLTGAMASGTGAMRPPDVGGLGLSADLKPLNLGEMKAAEVLADVAAGRAPRGALVFVPLMAGGDEDGVREDWVRLAADEPDERKRADYGALALVFASLAKAPGWRESLKEWKMERSPVTLEWEARGELRASRAKLLRVLEVVLKQVPPAEVVGAVQAQEDLETLDRWFDQALTVSTVEGARTAVGLPADA